MRKDIIFILYVIATVTLLSVGVFFFLQKANLQTALTQEKEISKKIHGEFERIKQEKKSLDEEKEKLRSGSVSYLTLNNQLQVENEKFEKTLEQLKQQIKEKDGQIDSLKQLNDKKPKQVEKKTEEKTKEKQAQNQKLIKEIDQCREKNKFLEETLKKERVVFYYNLGVAYSKAKLYEEAIEAYKKSLTLDATNPEANYNLALLYEKVKQEPEIAVLYYRKYLKLRPDANDKKEVLEEIGNLNTEIFAP